MGYHGKVYNWDFLNMSQWMKTEDLQDIQLEGLKELVEFARKECPYYKNLPEIRDLNDLRQIPILTKSLINKNWKDILVEKIPHCITTTGGTISKTTVAGDLRISNGFEEQRFQSWYPEPRGEKKACYLWGNIEIGQHIKPIVFNSKLWLPVEGLRNQETANSFISKIISFRPDYIKAYAGPMYILSRYALELGKANYLKGIVKTIVTHCETLTQEMRKTIEEVFGCEVFNFYGSRDLGSQAQDCSFHSDLHTTMERYIIEVMEGRFLFTDLLNHASPLIRYENQDVGEFGSPCQCGRGLITIKPLVGRVLSYLQDKNGNWISGFIIYLPVMYYDRKYETDLFGWVESYQIRQREQGKITVLLKSWSHTNPPIDLSRQLEVLKKYAKDFDVSIEIVNEISKSSTGKQLAVDTTLRRWE